jgi:hypothetical protein
MNLKSCFDLLYIIVEFSICLRYGIFPPILADLAASQPLGLSSALSALPTMAGALGGTQSGMVNQQGPDQITNYLSRMSRNQLLGLVSEIKVSKIDSAV